MQSIEESQLEPKRVGGARPGAGAPHGNTNGQIHGLNSLKKAWSKLGDRRIDGRSPAAIAIRKWRAKLIDDLGGKDSISAQQECLIVLVCRTKFLLDSVDAWLFTQESLINKRKRSVYPVLLQRQQLADGLARYITALGLEKKIKPQTWKDVNKQRQGQAQGAKVNAG